jgi:hypothetical protein
MNRLCYVLFFMAFAKMGFGQEDMSWQDDYEQVRKKGNFYIVTKNGKVGVVNHQGKEIIPLIYYIDAYEPFEPIHAGFHFSIDNQKHGLIDSTNKVIIPFIYDNLLEYGNLLLGQIKGKSGFLNLKGEVVVPFIYDELSMFRNGFALARKEEKCGVVNEKGAIIIPFDYEFHHEMWQSFAKNGLFILKKEGKFGAVNKLNKVIIPFQYDGIWEFTSDYTVMKKGRLYGIINDKGNVLVEPKYPNISTYYNGIAKVETDNLIIYINEKGEPINSVKYKSATDFKFGLANVSEDGEQYYCINTKGERAFEMPRNSYCRWFINSQLGLSSTEKNYYGGYYGLINKEGKQVVPNEFHEIFFFPNFLLARKYNVYTLIDTLGNIVDNFEHSTESTEQYLDKSFPFCLKKNGKYGFLDKNGKVSIGFQYDNAASFNFTPFAQVCKNGKCGFINQQNQVILPLEYEFTSGLQFAKYMPIRKGGKYGLIDRKGKEILPFVYDYIEVVRNLDYFKLNKGGLYGVANQKGEIVVPIIYDYIDLKPNLDYLRVNKNEKQGIINLKNETLISLVYDRIEVVNAFYAKPKFEKNEGFTVEINDKKGFVSNKNILVTPCEYDKIESAGNVIFATLGDKIHAYAFDGKILTKNKEIHYPISLGENKLWATVVKGNYYSIVFPDGTYLPCIYDKIEPWWENPNFVFVTNSSNKTAVFNMKGEKVKDFDSVEYQPLGKKILVFLNVKDYLYGIMDSTLRFVFPPTFYRIEISAAKTIIAHKADRNEKDGTFSNVFSGLIDDEGKIILPFEYQSIEYIHTLENNLGESSFFYKIKKENKVSLVNLTLETIIPAEYEDMTIEQPYQLIIVKKAGKYGIFDYTGKLLIPCEYDSLKLPFPWNNQKQVNAEKNGKAIELYLKKM